MVTCDADDLQLFLANKDGAWLPIDDTLDMMLQSGVDTSAYTEMRASSKLNRPNLFGPDVLLGQDVVHVLVVVTQVHVLGKRTRGGEWFIDQIRTKKCRVTVDGNETDRITRYIEMAGFPPLAHPNMEYRKIMEGNSYVVIFTQLMKNAKLWLEKRADCSMVVTGNPGIGKSRFYLYCIFHLIFRTKVEVKELPYFYLDFLSSHIAETIIDQVDKESIQEVSEFAVVHNGHDSGSTSVLRGTIYALLCHKWFSLPKQHKLVLRPLGDGQASVDVSMPRELKTVLIRFSRLADIKAVESGVYYRPTLETFGALDAFVFVGNACYGLHMTLNRDHGINGAPLNAFIKWLEGVGIAIDRLYFTFVVPSHLGSEFKEQSIRTGSNSDSKRPGAAAKVNQFVASLDVIGERGQ